MSYGSQSGGGSNSAPISENDQASRYNRLLYETGRILGNNNIEMVQIPVKDQFGNVVSYVSRYGNTPDFSEYTDYNAPGYKALADGDYNRLEQNIVTSRTAPLDRAWSLRKNDINQSMSDRGLWASGVPDQEMQSQFEESFLPAYQQAGADAATQRYGLQAESLAQENAFNADVAQRKLDAKRWLPEYLQAAYQGSGGTTSSAGKSKGFSFSI